MRKTLAAVGSLWLLLAVGPMLALAQAAPQTTSQAAQSTEISDPLKGFDEFAAKLLAEWKVPGIAISVVKGGKVVYAQGFGFRDVKQGLKVTPQTLFAIGSCSKAFTALDMGILVDDGKVDWDAPVRKYLPSFKLYDEYASDHMTPRDLMSHRSGLPRHDFVWYGAPASRKELFDRLRFLEPNKEFRAVWQYQNLMFMTAGYLVGEVAGTTWEDFTRKRILEPLGMAATNFSVTESQKTADFALPYAEIKDKAEAIPFRNIDTIGPAGSINSNVMDMANWVMLNLAKGRFADKQIISQTALTQIHMPQMVVQQPIQYKEILYPSYGMGWMIVPYRGHLMLQHGGGIDGFTALVCLMPQDDFGLVILTNMSGTGLTGVLNYNICDRVLKLDEVNWNTRVRAQLNQAKANAEKAQKEADKDRKTGTKPSHPLDDYAGDYENSGYGTVSVVKSGDGLRVKLNSQDNALRHYHYDVFEVVGDSGGGGQKLVFQTDVKGNISGFASQLEPAVKDILFVKAPPKTMMDKNFLEKFVGDYQLMGIVAVFTLKDDKILTLTVPGQPTYELVPYRGMEFNFKGMAGYSIEFKLDAKGNVVEAVFNQPNGVFTAKKK